MDVKPIIKLHSTVLSLTTVLIFILWINVTELITTYPFLSIILSGLISLGVYRLLHSLISTIIRRNWRIKKLFFGKYYLQGTWVGYFIGEGGAVRLFRETFEQDFSGLIIRGESYTKSGSYHCSWTSEASNIDIIKGTLTYSYQTDAIDNTFINPGIAVFNFRRDNPSHPPKMLIGFSSDLYNDKKLKAMEKKVSDSGKYELKKAIEEATELYDENRNHF